MLDANILIRAALGTRVIKLLKGHETATFITADVCVRDAERHLTSLCKQRRLPLDVVIERLRTILHQVQVVDASFYAEEQTMAERRLAPRDIADWPILATALIARCPIWTEDQDFFGCGVATWTTQTVELYLQES